jgi:DNA-binding CsgD family transcriptional regulator
MGRRGRPPYPDILTPREWEVLRLVEDGYTNDEIASRLGISLAGAKFHVSEILGKLHLESRNEAARWYRARYAPVPLWAPLLDWLRRTPHKATAAVGVAAIAVALAAVTALGFAVAGTDKGDSPGENGRLQRPPSPTPAPSQAQAALEPLPPGTHDAPTFWPPLTFTVPDVSIDELFEHVVWLDERETEGLVNLVPDTPQNRARTQAGGYPLTFLDVFRNIAVAAENCAQASAPGVGPTASDIAGALANRPGLITSGPVPVTIGGLSGQQIDLSIAPDWTGTGSGGTPFVPLVYSPNFIWWGAEPGERWRIIVLDVAGLPRGMFCHGHDRGLRGSGCAVGRPPLGLNDPRRIIRVRYDPAWPPVHRPVNGEMELR